MLSTLQAAERLGVSGQRVRQLLEAGKLKGERIGSVWVVDEQSVNDRVTRMKTEVERPERRRQERRERRRVERRQE